MATNTGLFITRPATNLQNGEHETTPFTQENNERDPEYLQPVVVRVVHRRRKDDDPPWRAYCVGFAILKIVIVLLFLMLGGKSSKRSYSYSYDRPTYSVENYNIDYLPKTQQTKSPSFKDTNFFSSQNWDMSCYGSGCDNAVREIVNSLNESVDPCDNFYEFACQGWQQRNSIPNHRDEWSVFSKVEQQTTKIVIDMLNEPVVASELEALKTAKRYFSECIKAHSFTNDTDKNKDMQLILDKLEQYGGWPILYENGTWNGSRFDWMTSVVGLKNELDLTAILDVTPYQSITGIVSDNTIFLRSPSAVSRSVELPEDKEVQDAINTLMTYKDFIVNVSRELLKFSGKSVINETYLEQRAFEIMYVQREFSKLRSRASGPSSGGLPGSSKFTVQKLQSLIDMSSFFLDGIDVLKLLNKFYADTGLSIRNTQLVNVPNLQYLLDVSITVSTFKKEALANYLHFYMVFQMMPLSNIEKFHEWFDTLQTVLKGTATKFPREQSCASKVQKKFPFALGHAFVKRKEAKILFPFLPKFGQGNPSYDFKKVRNMFSNIKNEFYKLVTYSKDPYINKTILNLEVLVTDICPGYPSWITSSYRVLSEYTWLNLSSSNQQSTGYLEQSILINKWAASKKLSELSQPSEIDGCKWTRFLGTVGAFHQMFSVYVPLGILQPPYYDENLPRSLNYGRLGGIIGHEIAHGLAGFGWSEFKDGTKTPVANCLINQYSNYRFDNFGDPNMTVNGNLTLEENLADNAGLLAAYKAYKTSTILVDNKHTMRGLEIYNNDQLFYIGFAQNWCEITTEEGIRSTLESDVHSPAQFRVLGTLQNSKEFAQAWKCPLGSNMNPIQNLGENKCTMF